MNVCWNKRLNYGFAMGSDDGRIFIELYYVPDIYLCNSETVKKYKNICTFFIILKWQYYIGCGIKFIILAVYIYEL